MENETKEYEILMDKKIGNIEMEKLKPAIVEIIMTEIVEVGEKKNKKVCCWIEHPDSKEKISISNVKIEIDNKLKVAGMWLNLDKEMNILKNSAIAKLMRFLKAESLKGLEGKKVETILDERGYLAFKGY